MCASPLMGMDRKECYRLTKISGYATACTFRVTSLFPGLPGSAGSRKANLIWILPNKQETVRGSDISWATCKSAPRSRQITVPASHRSNAEKYFFAFRGVRGGYYTALSDDVTHDVFLLFTFAYRKLKLFGVILWSQAKV